MVLAVTGFVPADGTFAAVPLTKGLAEAVLGAVVVVFGAGAGFGEATDLAAAEGGFGATRVVAAGFGLTSPFVAASKSC